MTPARSRSKLRYALLVVISLVATQLVATVSADGPDANAGPSAAGRPNILVVLADDHAFQAISAYGSVLVDTPHIDRLAAEGIRFDQAFVGNALGAPSRATLLTGLHSHAHGVRTDADVFDGSQRTVQGLLQAAGYATALVGHWDLKSDPTGFDHWAVLQAPGNDDDTVFRGTAGERHATGGVTDAVTDLAIEWLEGRQDEDRPFLLLASHQAPRRSWWPSPEEQADVQSGPFPEPETLFDDYATRPAAAAADMRIAEHMPLDREQEGSPGTSRALPEGDDLTRWKYQRYVQNYLATVRALDANLGRLLGALEASGELDDTLIVYTSDQGVYLGEHGWFGSGFMYEESFRTPLILRWPGHVEAGGVRDQALVQNIDLAPTLLDVAGEPVPEDMHGQSLAPLFTADDRKFRDAVYYHYYTYPGAHGVQRHYGVRNYRFKLIRFYHEMNHWEFYDLKEDPRELSNVYDDPLWGILGDVAHKQLDKLQQRYGDSPELAETLLRADLERGED